MVITTHFISTLRPSLSEAQTDGLDNRYNRYGRYGDNERYDDKINVGQGGDLFIINMIKFYTPIPSGEVRIINGGADAELRCEFPVGSHIISNIIWERDDRLRSRSYNRYNRYNRYNYRE